MPGWDHTERWIELLSGTRCPFCSTPAPADSPVGGDLARSREVWRQEGVAVRLLEEGRDPGECVVFPLRHVIEPFELSSSSARRFFDVMRCVGQAVSEVCQPAKVNYEITGNDVPHLHALVRPRYSEAERRPDIEALHPRLAARVEEIFSGRAAQLRFGSLGPESLGSLQELCESCADYYHLMTGESVGPEEAHTLFTLRPETASQADKFLTGVWYGTQLVGALDLYRHYPTRGQAWLGLLILHPELRGRGLGTEMIAWTLQWARGQECQCVRIGIADDNTRALEVLARQGFRPTGERISRVSGSRRLVLLPLECRLE